MTMSDAAVPAPFTSDDYADRMSRVVNAAASKGLAGVIVMPGPDLVRLAGYQPPAVTERLTMLVLKDSNELMRLAAAAAAADSAYGEIVQRRYGALSRQALTRYDRV
jgi:hypothetical protein